MDLGRFDALVDAMTAVRAAGGVSRAMPRGARALRRAMAQYRQPIGPLRPCACGCGSIVRTVVARWLPSHDKRLSPVDWVESADGCWIWQLKVNHNGYGSVRVGGRTELAHRVTYEREYGAGSAAGLQVHHECGEKRCVNPAHLSALTPEEHSRVHAEMARELWRLRCAA